MRFLNPCFLAAGVVIQAMNEEHSIFKMGGLRKQLPLAFGTFLIAGCSLAGLPLITAGFYSKGLIVWEAWASPQGSTVLWLAGVFGVLLTALYIFRVIFLVFFGEAKAQVTKRPGYKIQIPLMILAVLSVVSGFVNLPPKLGNEPLFTRLLDTVLPAAKQGHFAPLTEIRSEEFLALAFLLGLGFAYLLYLRNPGWSGALTATRVGKALHEFWFADWGFDWCYDKLFVQPILWFARIDKSDVVDVFYKWVADLNELLYRGLSLTENGRVRWYAAGIVAGTVVFVAIVLFL